ncbi:MAG TPA: thiamine pyrophosphate-binding protein, partial [Trebonia sp.]|nr:thiamine pyrophosphate-binding protein [Trebonia sp.]
MTEQTSPVPPKAHAASGPEDQPPGRPHPGPSPLDIPARSNVPAAPKPAPSRPASPAHRDAPAAQAGQPAGTQPAATHSPRPQNTQPASAPQGAGSAAGAGGGAQAAAPAQTIKATVTGAQALVMALEQLGVDVVFGIPGGAVLPAYDPLLDSSKIRHILVRHEQGAGHAATGYAQAT